MSGFPTGGAAIVRQDFHALRLIVPQWPLNIRDSAVDKHLDQDFETGIDLASIADGQLISGWHHARFSVLTDEAVGAPAFAPIGLFGTTRLEYLARRRAPVDCI
jgi:hypothetical protein